MTQPTDNLGPVPEGIPTESTPAQTREERTSNFVTIVKQHIALFVIFGITAIAALSVDELGSRSLKERYAQLQPDVSLQAQFKAAGFVMGPGIMEVGCLPVETSKLSPSYFVDNCWSSSFRFRGDADARSFTAYQVVHPIDPVAFVVARADSAPLIDPSLGFMVSRSPSGLTYEVRSTFAGLPVTEAQVASVVAAATVLKGLGPKDMPLTMATPVLNSTQTATAP